MIPNVGMAIRITEKNRDKLGVVNGGIVPEIEEVNTYFVFPYKFDEHCLILPEDVFFDNYEFANTPNDEYFVDINEI